MNIQCYECKKLMNKKILMDGVTIIYNCQDCGTYNCITLKEKKNESLSEFQERLVNTIKKQIQDTIMYNNCIIRRFTANLETGILEERIF